MTFNSFCLDTFATPLSFKMGLQIGNHLDSEAALNLIQRKLLHELVGQFRVAKPYELMTA